MAGRGAADQDCACVAASPPTGVESPIVVLVHGTYARHAPWAAADGPLGSRLTAAGAVVGRFCWTGRNRHRDRLEAGDALRDHLLDLRRDNPGAPLRVVAHSHGGNVALYALRPARPEDPDPLVDVEVTALATPFLTARPRPLPPAVRRLLLAAECLLGIFGLAVVWWLATAAGGPSAVADEAAFAVEGVLLAVGLLPDDRVARAIGTAVLLTGGLFAWLCAVRPISAWLFAHGGGTPLWAVVRDPALAGPRSIAAPLPSDGRLTVVRGLGDEADAALGFSQLLTSVWSRVARLYRVRTLLTVGASVFVLAVVAWNLAAALIASEGAFEVVERTGEAATAVALVALVLAGPVLIVVMHLTAAAFGVDGLFLTPAFSLTAEPSPVGVATVHQVSADAAAPGLAHAVYDAAMTHALLEAQVRADAARSATATVDVRSAEA